MKNKKQKSQLTARRIIALLKQHGEDIRKFGVVKIGLFGSFLKEKQNKKSDVDILVRFDNVTFDNYMDLKFYLEELFGKEVDLVIERSLKPALRYVKREALYV